jgi:hypothetical protein
LTFLFGIGEGAIPYIALVQFLTAGLVLTLSPVVYQSVE